MEGFPHFGVSLRRRRPAGRQALEKTAAQPDDFLDGAAGGARARLREDALPRRLREGGTGATPRTKRSPGAGTPQATLSSFCCRSLPEVSM